MSKYKNRLGDDFSKYDKLAMESMNRELDALAQEVEAEKQAAVQMMMDDSGMPMAAYGVLPDNGNNYPGPNPQPIIRRAYGGSLPKLFLGSYTEEELKPTVPMEADFNDVMQFGIPSKSAGTSPIGPEYIPTAPENLTLGSLLNAPTLKPGQQAASNSGNSGSSVPWTTVAASGAQAASDIIAALIAGSAGRKAADSVSYTPPQAPTFEATNLGSMKRAARERYLNTIRGAAAYSSPSGAMAVGVDAARQYSQDMDKIAGMEDAMNTQGRNRFNADIYGQQMESAKTASDVALAKAAMRTSGAGDAAQYVSRTGRDLAMFPQSVSAWQTQQDMMKWIGANDYVAVKDANGKDVPGILSDVPGLYMYYENGTPIYVLQDGTRTKDYTKWQAAREAYHSSKN